MFVLLYTIAIRAYTPPMYGTIHLIYFINNKITPSYLFKKKKIFIILYYLIQPKQKTNATLLYCIHMILIIASLMFLVICLVIYLYVLIYIVLRYTYHSLSKKALIVGFCFIIACSSCVITCTLSRSTLTKHKNPKWSP